MYASLTRWCASKLCRVTRIRTWRIVVVVLMLLFSLYVLKSTSKTKRDKIMIQEDAIDDAISKNPVNLMFKKLEKAVAEKQESNENSSIPAGKCRLPVLDPLHSSVKDIIIDLGELECGTTHSKFENNTLTVEAQDAVSVSYRIISRPKGNDFESSLSSPISMKSTAKDSRSSNSTEFLSPGKKGCLLHVESKKCLHPFGGESNPPEGTQLVYHSDCCFNRIKFKMNADRTIQHVPSGLCLNVADNTVKLQSNCSTKFKVKNGVLQDVKSGLCIEQKDISKPPDNDESVVAGKSCTKAFNAIQLHGKAFRGSAQVDADFVRVDIKRPAGKEDITEVHMQTAPKPETLRRKIKHSGIPVNVAMIMFDSTSAANFIRKMPKSNAFLKKKPTAFMKGNTIVGDGTTAQLSAMITGIPEEEQPEARRSKPNAKVVDNWRLAFKDFREQGYVTMFTEDSPGLATFNYRLKGFTNPPTDHYGRYFWMEAQKHRKKEHCAGNDAMHRITFNYFLSLFRTYRDQPKFSLILFSDLTHDNINAIQFADDDLLRLLQTMEQEGFLEDTILFLFGDHGLRFGKMRKTLQGKLEERLPHLSITFPTWFTKKHPKLYEAVQHNSNYLTTPFDTYSTLQHILSYPLPPSKRSKFGQSLFVPIVPENRTCATSGVEDHWCPCMNFETVSIRSRVVKRLANVAVKYINKLLEQESKVTPLCHILSLKEIKTAVREMPNENVQKFKHSYQDHRCDSCGAILGEKDENTLAEDTVYQIQFVTSPNNGFFEASIKLHKGEPTLKGSISRVDAYGHQPDCIKDTYVHLLKYCYCKNNS